MTPEINERMRLALEHRAKALEAVKNLQKLLKLVEAPSGELWVRAKEAVKAVEAASEITAGDFELCDAKLSSCQFKKGQAQAALDDAASDFDELKADPNLRRVASEAFVLSALAKAEKALNSAQVATAGNGADADSCVAAFDLAKTKAKYGELIDTCSADTADARRTTRDMQRTMEKVAILCKEAADGAVRCLLDYTIERAQQAEQDAADLDSRIATFEAKAKEITDANDALKEESTASVAAVEKLVVEGILLDVDVVNAELAEVRSIVQKAAELAVGNAAATKLQKRVRILLARSLMQKKCKEAKEALSIVILQCSIRCWLARQTVDVMRLEKKEEGRRKDQAAVKLQTLVRIRRSKIDLRERKRLRTEAIAKAKAEAEAAKIAAEAEQKARTEAAAAEAAAAEARQKAEEAAALVAAAADAEAKAKAEKEASEAQAALKKAAAEAAAAEEARIAKKKQAEEIAKQQAKAEEEAATSSLALEQIKIEDKSGEDAYDPHTRPRQATVDIVVSGPASNLDAEAMATVSESSNQRDDKNANPADSTTSKSKQSPSLTEKSIMKSSSAKPEVVHEVPDDIIVLKERAGYEPTVEEIDNYAEWLGLEDDEDHLMWIPRKAMSSPLPKPWKPCKARDTGEVFYFNPLTNESLWHHPQDDHWANLFAQCKVSEKVIILYFSFQ